MLNLIAAISVGLIVGIVAGVVGVILIIWLIASFITIYNKLVKLQERVDNAWSQIDVQLKKRYDLVPNLVETVKGYAKHEKETLENVTRARASVGSAKTPEEMMSANNSLGNALSRLLVVAERYPQLMANSNFTRLQEELSEIEDKIAFTRQFYNDTVTKYNEYVRRFPSNLFAKMYGFKVRPYFEVEEAQKEAPKVQF